MKLTYNFGILKNKVIGIEIKGTLFYNMLLSVKQNSKSIFLKFEKSTLEINKQHFLQMQTDEINGIICFKESNTPKFVNGMFLYSMYNTQGVPFEILKDLLEDDGFIVDEKGFYNLLKVQKKVSDGTFLTKNETFK